MNFSLYIIGTPDGYDQYPLDSNSDKFHALVSSCGSGSCLSVLRNNQLVQYVYVRRMSGEDDSCLGFGFVLVVTGVYCVNCHALNELFETAFYDVLLKGKLFDFQENKCGFLVSRFVDDVGEINRIRSFFESKLESEFKELFVPVPPSFSVGNGETSVSFKDSVADINSAVESFDVVHIANDENTNPIKKIRSLKIKRWMLWGMLALLVLFSAAVVTNVVVHQKKEEIRQAEGEEHVQKLKNKHEKAVRDFDSDYKKIVVEDGNEFLVKALLSLLQTIEQCETDPLFLQTETEPVAADKRKLYIKELTQAKDNIIRENKDELDRDLPYYNDLRRRLKIMEFIIKQMTDSNSALDVHIEDIDTQQSSE